MGVAIQAIFANPDPFGAQGVPEEQIITAMGDRFQINRFDQAIHGNTRTITPEQMNRPIEFTTEGRSITGIAFRLMTRTHPQFQSVLRLQQNPENRSLWTSSWDGRNLQSVFEEHHLGQLTHEERQQHEENPFFTCANCPSTEIDLDLQILRDILSDTSQVVQLR